MNFFTSLLISLCILLVSQSTFSQQEFEMKEGDTTYIMKEYYFCMLKAGEKSDDYDSLQLAEIQAGHMANLKKLEDAGKLHMAGPFGDDGKWRGILILEAKNLEEAENMVKNDPAVKAGRLNYEVHQWWAAKGSTLK